MTEGTQAYGTAKPNAKKPLKLFFLKRPQPSYTLSTLTTMVLIAIIHISV